MTASLPECEFQVLLAPPSGSADALRVMSVLHGRAVALRSFVFKTGEDGSPTVMIQVAATDCRAATLEAALGRIIGVVAVDRRPV